RHPRHQFIADAVVVELESDTRFKAKTGDLSIGGCFLDMLNPSPEGTEVEITIVRRGLTFCAVGKVVFVFPNLGMGVAFTNIATSQMTILEEWLGAPSLHRDPVR